VRDAVAAVHRNIGLRQSDDWQTQSTLSVLGAAGGRVVAGSPLCSRLGGLSPGQRRFCQLYEDHMPSVARAVQLGVAECQRQFRFRRWNCSTAAPQQTGNTNASSSLFGRITDIGLSTLLLRPPPIVVRSIAIFLSVCLPVCPLAYLKNRISKLHEIFCTCYLQPCLCPPPVTGNTLCTSGFADDVIFSP